MKLNNNGWGLMAFLILAFVIVMIIFLAAGEIKAISDVMY